MAVENGELSIPVLKSNSMKYIYEEKLRNYSARFCSRSMPPYTNHILDYAATCI